MARVWNDGHRFSGRVVLVTGAGGTLGGAIARGFGGEGASVLVGYRRSQSGGRVGGSRHRGCGRFSLRCGSSMSPTRLRSTGSSQKAETVYGRIDVLVNTAGRIDESDTARFEDMSPDAATALLMVDVVGSMRMCHAVIPHMRRNGSGAIINFSSTYGNGVHPGEPDQLGAGHLLRRQGRDPRVHGLPGARHRTRHPRQRARARSLSPGTGRTSGALDPEHIEEAKAMNPMKRFGDPREIAETVMFLASDGAGYINGQVIRVEGGWVAAG